jgi:hypothetical protein
LARCFSLPLPFPLALVRLAPPVPPALLVLPALPVLLVLPEQMANLRP